MRGIFGYQSLHASLKRPPQQEFDENLSDSFLSATDSPTSTRLREPLRRPSITSMLNNDEISISSQDINSPNDQALGTILRKAHERVISGRRKISSKMRRVHFQGDNKSIIIAIIVFLSTLLLLLSTHYIKRRNKNPEDVSKELGTLSRHLTRVHSYYHKQKKTNKARALWVDHVVYAQNDEILLADTFESRLNAELAPFVSNTLEKLWKNEETLTCGVSERVLMAFTLPKSSSIPASISFKRSCQDASELNGCRHEHYVRDLRDVIIQVPKKSSRYSFAVFAAEDRHHVTRGNLVDRARQVESFGPIRGSFQVELSDAAQIAVQRYCGSSRRNFMHDLMTKPLSQTNTRTVTLFELKRLYRISCAEHNRSTESHSWDSMQFSQAVIDPIDHSRHSLTWIDMMQHLLGKKSPEDQYDLFEKKFELSKKNESFKPVSVLELQKQQKIWDPENNGAKDVSQITRSEHMTKGTLPQSPKFSEREGSTIEVESTSRNNPSNELNSKSAKLESISTEGHSHVENISNDNDSFPKVLPRKSVNDANAAPSAIINSQLVQMTAKLQNSNQAILNRAPLSSMMERSSSPNSSQVSNPMGRSSPISSMKKVEAKGTDYSDGQSQMKGRSSAVVPTKEGLDTLVNRLQPNKPILIQQQNAILPSGVQVQSQKYIPTQDSQHKMVGSIGNKSRFHTALPTSAMYTRRAAQSSVRNIHDTNVRNSAPRRYQLRPTRKYGPNNPGNQINMPAANQNNIAEGLGFQQIGTHRSKYAIKKAAPSEKKLLASGMRSSTVIDSQRD